MTEHPIVKIFELFLILGCTCMLFYTGHFIVSGSCVVVNGDIVSDPFNQCFTSSYVSLSTGTIVNNTVIQSPDSKFWWINLTVFITDLRITRYHLMIVNDNQDEAMRTSALFPITASKIFDITDDRCDPNSGKGHTWVLVLLIIPVLINVWLLKDFITKCNNFNLCQSCNLSSIIYLWLLISVVPILFLVMVEPNCQKNVCARTGTYSLPMMKSQANHTECYTDGQMCQVVWILHDGPTQVDLVALNGVCTEKKQHVANNTRTGYVLVNPSTKTDCKEIPEIEISEKRFWILAGTSFACFGLLFAFLFLITRRRSEIDQRLDNCCIRICSCFTGYRLVVENQQSDIEM